MTNVLTINDLEGFDKFVRLYGTPGEEWFWKVTSSECHNYIYWENVQADGYWGVEINPYLWERRFDEGLWYNGWDCASGVIWDKKALIDSHLIAYEEKGEVKDAIQWR